MQNEIILFSAIVTSSTHAFTTRLTRCSPLQDDFCLILVATALDRKLQAGFELLSPESVWECHQAELKQKGHQHTQQSRECQAFL